MIYVGSYNGRIFSISPNGTGNWFFQTGDSVLSSPAIDNNGIIYCGSLDGNLYTLNPNGTLRWKFNTGNSIESSPIIGAEGTIYIANWGGYLYAINTIYNQPPSTPTINGPASGKIGRTYDYTIVSTDPEGNNISYYVDWGDGTNSGWIGPYDSGDEQTVSHTWETKGTYTIQVKAKDWFGAESGWGTLQITMPMNSNMINSPFLQLLERFFERHPFVFPLLRHLLIE
jgi:outer membrane protein assembly factor BamB